MCVRFFLTVMYATACARVHEGFTKCNNTLPDIIRRLIERDQSLIYSQQSQIRISVKRIKLPIITECMNVLLFHV